MKRLGIILVGVVLIVVTVSSMSSASKIYGSLVINPTKGTATTPLFIVTNTDCPQESTGFRVDLNETQILDFQPFPDEIRRVINYPLGKTGGDLPPSSLSYLKFTCTDGVVDQLVFNERLWFSQQGEYADICAASDYCDDVAVGSPEHVIYPDPPVVSTSTMEIPVPTENPVIPLETPELTVTPVVSEESLVEPVTCKD